MLGTATLNVTGEWCRAMNSCSGMSDSSPRILFAGGSPDTSIGGFGKPGSGGADVGMLGMLEKGSGICGGCGAIKNGCCGMIIGGCGCCRRGIRLAPVTEGGICGMCGGGRTGCGGGGAT